MTVVCPAAGLNPEVRHRVELGQVAHVDRLFLESDLDAVPEPVPAHPEPKPDPESGPPAPSLLLLAIASPAASTAAYRAAQRRRIPANIADVPPECDFYFGAVHRAGPVQVLVSTNGRGPRLAAALKRHIAAHLPRAAGPAVENVGLLRAALRARAPGDGVDEGRRRMRWMSRVCDRYGWEELGVMDEVDRRNLLEGWWEGGEVPRWAELRALRGAEDGGRQVWEFDGSFGFSVGC